MLGKNPIPLDPLSKVIEVIISVGLDSLKDRAQRSEKVMRAFSQLGWKPNSPPANDFDGIYAYTLVFYGIGKPRPVLEFFRHPYIKDAFQKSFLQKNPKILEDEAENLLDWNEIGKELLELDYDPKNEFSEFRRSFIEYALSTRTIPEVLQGQAIEQINEALTKLPTKTDVKNILENVSRRERDRSQQNASENLNSYLRNVLAFRNTVELPAPIQAAFDIELQRIPSETLYHFEDYDGKDSTTPKNQITYHGVLESISRLSIPILLIGESGIGKTSLFQQMLYDQAKEYLDGKRYSAPILIKLSFYSQKRNLLDLIVEYLNSRGAQVDEIYVTKLLQEGKLILLLDAFDEVFDQYIPEIERELQLIQGNYPLCKIIITTRQFRLPSIFPCKKYKVLSLSYREIEGVAKSYLQAETEAFLQEIEKKQLMGLASNTLLLVLLILLYKQNKILPQSRGQILEAVVSRIKTISETKPKRSISKLSWDVKTEILAHLAYLSLQQGFSYILKRELAEEKLLKKLDVLQNTRRISLGLTIDDTILELAATGFIIAIEQSGLIFWHRAFLEYFACFEIAKHIESNNKILKNMLIKPEWAEMLPYAISKTKNFEKMINRVLHLNVFVAAYSLLERSVSSSEVHANVIDALVKKCNSKTIPIRVIAIRILRQFNDEHTTQVLQELLTNNFVNIQKVALIEIAKRKTEDAYKIVHSRIDWNARGETWMEGNASNAVIEALGEFDDPSVHLEIIKRWREKPDIFTSRSCQQALLRVIKRKVLDDSIRKVLLDFFLGNESDTNHYHKLWEIRDLLIILKDNSMVPILINRLIMVSESESTLLPSCITDILSNFEDAETVRQIIEKYTDTSLSISAKRYIAKILSNSKGNVPVSVYSSFIASEDFKIQSEGILGLAKLDFEENKSIILKAIHPPISEDLQDIDHTYAYVQNAAFEVLAANKQLDLILLPENRPRYFYNLSLDVLFDYISENQSLNFVPFLVEMLYRFEYAREQIKISIILARIGEVTRAEEALLNIYHNNQSQGVIYEVLKGIHFFSPQMAITIIKDVVELTTKNNASSSYDLELCCEALELIGTSDATKVLIQIIDRMKGTKEFGIRVERGFRALELLSPEDQEDWMIEMIVQNSEKMEAMSLRRGLETLGVIGGSKSLPILTNHFERSDGEIQVTCFWAIRQIYIKEGFLWYNNEEKIDK